MLFGVFPLKFRRKNKHIYIFSFLNFHHDFEIIQNFAKKREHKKTEIAGVGVHRVGGVLPALAPLEAPGVGPAH